MPEILETLPEPVHSVRFVLDGRYEDIEPRVCAAGFTDSLFVRRDGKNYLVVDHPLTVGAHSLVSDCLQWLQKAGIEVKAIEVYDINDTITASYVEACQTAQRLLEDEMDGLEPHNKFKLEIARYEIHLEEYLEAYSPA